MNEENLTTLLTAYAASPAPETLERLVEGYLPLSRAIARKFAGRGVELDDLEQVAAMALMKAIQRFEPDRGLKFSTFAMPTIAGEVRNYLRDKGSMLRMSRDSRSLLYRLQRVRDELTQQLQRFADRFHNIDHLGAHGGSFRSFRAVLQGGAGSGKGWRGCVTSALARKRPGP